eukprot:c13945_g1_i2.p1 GENE.c13945_g1_i2~~c13945_g1_i2.p1  ORF type:complete len:253 (+),score=26.51 c13945_g1_i2:55-759(+)
MCGHSHGMGAVIGVKHFVNPIRIARAIMETSADDFRILAGSGAEAFAVENGLESVDARRLICEREQQRWESIRKSRTIVGHHSSHAFLPKSPTGTVGAVALDSRGNLACATSTGGTPFKRPGRVGDSPLPGGGYYASKHAACSATGWGEAIATALTSARCVALASNPETQPNCAQQGIRELHQFIANPSGEGATGGVIVMSKDGVGYCAYSTPRMARGGWSTGESVWVELDAPN